LSGGYLLLELEEEQAFIVDGMWATVQPFYAQKGDDAEVLYHQNIARGSDIGAGDTVLPTTIQEALGNTEQSQRGVAYSFVLFANMGSTAVASVVSAGVLDKDPKVMQEVLEGLLHDRTGQYTCANHRLSRYILVDDEEEDEFKESLGSHTDRTLTTPIPEVQHQGSSCGNQHHANGLLPKW
jgi:hypothetical protein